MALVHKSSVTNAGSIVIEAKGINWLSPAVDLRSGQWSRLDLLRFLSWPHFLAPDTLPLCFLAVILGLIIRLHLIIDKWTIFSVAQIRALGQLSFLLWLRSHEQLHIVIFVFHLLLMGRNEFLNLFLGVLSFLT